MSNLANAASRLTPAPSADHGPSEAGPRVPKLNHDLETPEVREHLEALDDAMFAAIAGHAGALAPARTLWTAAAGALPAALVDESREQYLRYAAEVMRRFELAEIRDPAAAIAALEVIELLAQA